MNAVNWRRIVDVLSGSEVPVYGQYYSWVLLDYCPHCGVADVEFIADTPEWRRHRRTHKVVCELTRAEVLP
jgi:hypothetical protein